MDKNNNGSFYCFFFLFSLLDARHKTTTPPRVNVWRYGQYSSRLHIHTPSQHTGHHISCPLLFLDCLAPPAFGVLRTPPRCGAAFRCCVPLPAFAAAPTSSSAPRAMGYSYSTRLRRSRRLRPCSRRAHRRRVLEWPSRRSKCSCLHASTSRHWGMLQEFCGFATRRHCCWCWCSRAGGSPRSEWPSRSPPDDCN